MSQSDPTESADLEAVELLLTVPSTAVEVLAPLCWLLSPQGIQTEDVASLGAAGLVAGQTRIHLFVDPAEAQAATLRLQAEAAALGVDAKLDHRDLARQDWNAEWKKHFVPIEVAGRVRVEPSWLQGPDTPGLIRIAIDPGMAFGTGTHETTQLCMTALCDLADAARAHGADLGQQTLLDAGTGSAILAILAHRLGWRGVVGTEIDAAATRTARYNAELARLEVADAVPAASPDTLALLHTGDPNTVGPALYDVVVANILASILIPLRDALLARAKPGAVILLSGILAKQADEVVRHYQAAGATLVEQRVQAAWTALLLRAP